MVTQCNHPTDCRFGHRSLNPTNCVEKNNVSGGASCDIDVVVPDTEARYREKIFALGNAPAIDTGVHNNGPTGALKLLGANDRVELSHRDRLNAGYTRQNGQADIGELGLSIGTK
jgi:hypothetical protein